MTQTAEPQSVKGNLVSLRIWGKGMLRYIGFQSIDRFQNPQQSTVFQQTAQGIFMQYGITEDDDAEGIRNGGFGSTTK